LPPDAIGWSCGSRSRANPQPSALATSSGTVVSGRSQSQFGVYGSFRQPARRRSKHAPICYSGAHVHLTRPLGQRTASEPVPFDPGSGRTSWKTGPFAWPFATRTAPRAARWSRFGSGLVPDAGHDADSRPLERHRPRRGGSVHGDPCRRRTADAPSQTTAIVGPGGERWRALEPGRSRAAKHGLEAQCGHWPSHGWEDKRVPSVSAGSPCFPPRIAGASPLSTRTDPPSPPEDVMNPDSWKEEQVPFDRPRQTRFPP
jgi:hypothetical protein